MRLACKRYDLVLREPWRIASRPGAGAGGGRVHPTLFVRLEDRAGRWGLGEVPLVHREGDAPEAVIECLEKVDTRSLSFATRDAGGVVWKDRGAASRGIECALEAAWLDGVGRARAWSLGALLEVEPGTVAKHSSYSLGLAEPAVFRAKVRAAEAYPWLKLKVGEVNDLENLAMLRAEAPHKRVRIDANEAWTTREEALARIEAFAADPLIELVEQPMPAGTPLADLEWLKARSPLPLFADESYRTVADLEIAARGFHGVNVKLVKAGGPSRAVAALRGARASGLKTMIGCMIESSWLISAAAHLLPLADFVDLDGAALVANDPFAGAIIEAGSGRLDVAPLAAQAGVGAVAGDPAFFEEGWHDCGS